MTQKTSPFNEVKWGWNLGESGWNGGMDENLLKFSFLTTGNVDGVVSTLPSAVNGKAYFNTSDNRIYYVVEGVYYQTPVPKWFIFRDVSSGSRYQFDGSALGTLPSDAEQNTDILSVQSDLSDLTNDFSIFKTDLAEYTDPLKNAGLVGFDVDLDYAVNTVGHKLKDIGQTVVTVEDFGAVGDGVTDDTDAVEAAILYCGPKGITLHWKNSYRITRTITYTTSLQFDQAPRWTGNAGGTKIIFDFADGTPLFKFEGATLSTLYYGMNYGFIRGLTIIPPVGNSFGYSSQGAVFSCISLRNTEFESVFIKDVKGHGIDFPNMVAAGFENPDYYNAFLIHIHRCWFENIDGVGIRTANTTGFAYGLFEHNYINKCKQGGIVTGGAGVIIRQNAIALNGLGDGVTQYPGISLERQLFATGTYSTCANVIIEQNELDSNRTAHIITNGARSVRITQNRCNSWQTIYNDGLLTPPTIVKMVNTISGASNIDFTLDNNFVRFQAIVTGAPLDIVGTYVDMGNNSANNRVDVSKTLLLSTATNLVNYIANRNSNSNIVRFIDDNWNGSITPTYNKPYVLARTTAAGSITVAPATYVWASEQADSISWYNNSTGAITVPYTGILEYRVNFSLTSPAANTLRCQVQVGGVTVANHRYVGQSTASESWSFTGAISVTGGTSVTFVTNSSATDVTIDVGAVNNNTLEVKMA